MDGVAYFVRAVSYMCKKFMKLTTGATVKKIFPLSATAEQNKLECLPF
jgi:hypothetical protein